MIEKNIEEAKKIVGKGFLYVLENDVGLIKIGISDNPYNRFVTIENASGCKIIHYYISDGIDNNYEIEQQLHKHYKKNNTVGEWYKSLSFDIVTHYVDSFINDNGRKTKTSNYIKINREDLPIIDIDVYIKTISKLLYCASILKIEIQDKDVFIDKIDDYIFAYESALNSDKSKIDKVLELSRYSYALEKIAIHILSLCGTDNMLQSKEFFNFFNKYYGVEKNKNNKSIKHYTLLV